MNLGTNPELGRLKAELMRASRKNGAPIWNRVAEILGTRRRSRRVVNVGDLGRATSPDEVAIVPGKLLAAGAIEHRVIVAAFKFSAGARSKILRAGGRCVDVRDLLAENPKGTNVKVIG